MSRDRFQELQGQSQGGYGGGYNAGNSNQWSGYQASPHEQRIEMNNFGYNNGAAGGMNTDNEFFGLVDKITEQMSQVDQRIQQISQLHEQALNATSESKHTQAASDRDRLVGDTNAMITEIKRDLQRIDQVLQSSQNDPSVSKSQHVARASRQQGLAKKFSEQIQRYRQMEHHASTGLPRPDATDAEIADAIESDQAGQVFAQSVMQTSRVGEARRVLRDVEERQADIRKIEQTINELAQMFSEVSEMVNRQQEMIDNIESAVEDTHVHVETARQEVDKAIVFRKKSRKRLWCILALVVILIIIIVLIVYFTVIKKK
ncbi:t-SNARE [Linderina pennispora]|uniref:t-SNARE n=1 Tax=Linderina pennispora TaxID=61395 RepID=A0A1Y1W501_9FUNG|nr:t-SNARE [Linderina pennispora]ORX68633.1 t-SNARE [Linderina pennispora]